ncbi:MAG TPA: hypothetical protein VHV08_11665, partial [Pirellulales bacterium]|nr:hypothetical protein [Pirellulales bacterium]
MQQLSFTPVEIAKEPARGAGNFAWRRAARRPGFMEYGLRLGYALRIVARARGGLRRQSFPRARSFRRARKACITHAVVLGLLLSGPPMQALAGIYSWNGSTSSWNTG